MSDTESSDEDDILIPNGFVDVGADLVNIDFDQKDGGSSPPRKKSKRRRDEADALESFPSSTAFRPPSCFVVPPNNQNSVLDNSCHIVEDEVSLEDICEKVRREVNEETKRRSRRIANRNSSFHDDSVIVVTTPDASPKHKLDYSLTHESSICFDVDEEPLFPDTEDPNVEMSIKVVWKGCSTHHFTIRKFQKIKEIYTHYAELENIPEERVLFTLRDAPVSPNDTPLSLNIGVASLEGGVIDEAYCSTQKNEEDKNAMKLFVQRQGSKERHAVFTNPKEKISVLISKLSEELKIQAKLIKLKFDGEFLDSNSTPEDYDLEAEECIDLIETK